jgi:hypothetical protein
MDIIQRIRDNMGSLLILISTMLSKYNDNDDSSETTATTSTTTTSNNNQIMIDSEKICLIILIKSFIAIDENFKYIFDNILPKGHFNILEVNKFMYLEMNKIIEYLLVQAFNNVINFVDVDMFIHLKSQMMEICRGYFKQTGMDSSVIFSKFENGILIITCHLYLY